MVTISIKEITRLLEIIKVYDPHLYNFINENIDKITIDDLIKIHSRLFIN